MCIERQTKPAQFPIVCLREWGCAHLKRAMKWELHMQPHISNLTNASKRIVCAYVISRLDGQFAADPW